MYISMAVVQSLRKTSVSLCEQLSLRLPLRHIRFMFPKEAERHQSSPFFFCRQEFLAGIVNFAFSSTKHGRFVEIVSFPHSNDCDTPQSAINTLALDISNESVQHRKSGNIITNEPFL